jgi:transposase InsO family protein
MDQGTQFMSKMVKTIIQQYHIWHKVSTPYHPQANGQVESTNKVLEVIMTKTIKENHTDWADRLLEALWAYKTSWRNTTENSPYDLIYGKQILLPIEFQIKTFRMEARLGMDLLEAQKQRLLQLNELDEIR